MHVAGDQGLGIHRTAVAHRGLREFLWVVLKVDFGR